MHIKALIAQSMHSLYVGFHGSIQCGVVMVKAFYVIIMGCLNNMISSTYAVCVFIFCLESLYEMD